MISLISKGDLFPFSRLSKNMSSAFRSQKRAKVEKLNKGSTNDKVQRVEASNPIAPKVNLKPASGISDQPLNKKKSVSKLAKSKNSLIGSSTEEDLDKKQLNGLRKTKSSVDGLNNARLFIFEFWCQKRDFVHMNYLNA